MRTLHLLAAILFTMACQGQQVDWLQGGPVEQVQDPLAAAHCLASAPGMLVSVRMVDVTYIGVLKAYGNLAIEALDAATGTPTQTCLAGDSVRVRRAVVRSDGMAYLTGVFLGDRLELCDGSQLSAHGDGGTAPNLFLMAWDVSTGLPVWVRNLSVAHPDAVEVGALALDGQGRLWYTLQEVNEGHAIRVDASGQDVETRTVGNIQRCSGLSFDPWAACT